MPGRPIRIQRKTWEHDFRCYGFRPLKISQVALFCSNQSMQEFPSPHVDYRGPWVSAIQLFRRCLLVLSQKQRISFLDSLQLPLQKVECLLANRFFCIDTPYTRGEEQLFTNIRPVLWFRGCIFSSSILSLARGGFSSEALHSRS